MELLNELLYIRYSRRATDEHDLSGCLSWVNRAQLVNRKQPGAVLRRRREAHDLNNLSVVNHVFQWFTEALNMVMIRPNPGSWISWARTSAYFDSAMRRNCKNRKRKNVSQNLLVSVMIRPFLMKKASGPCSSKQAKHSRPKSRTTHTPLKGCFQYPPASSMAFRSTFASLRTCMEKS